MATKIQLKPEELKSLSQEMSGLQAEYINLSKTTIRILQDVNESWSQNLARNFERKISSAQKSLDGVADTLGIGAELAMKSAKSYESMDALLSSEMKKGSDAMSSVHGELVQIYGESIPATGSAGESPNPTYTGPATGAGKPYVNGSDNYKGHDYSNYTVLAGFDPSYTYNQHDYGRFVNASGKNVGCTATADAILASIHNGQPFDPNKEGWVNGQGATWTNSKSLKTGGCSESELLSITYQQIMSGNPVIVRVQGHSVTAVGIRNGADPNNLTAADILIADPGDGCVKALSESKRLDTSWGLRVPR